MSNVIITTIIQPALQSRRPDVTTPSCQQHHTGAGITAAFVELCVKVRRQATFCGSTYSRNRDCRFRPT